MLAGLLFLIFINDLPETILQSFTGIYCDDTLLAKEISNINDAHQLQMDLDNVLEWSKIWGMKFNASKCVQMTVTNKINFIQYKYHLGSDELSTKKSFKYLGITIDNKLSFKEHIQDKCKKASTVLNMLKRSLYFAPRSVKQKAYMACVLPIIEYASSCWSPTSIKLQNSLEMIHHNAAKFVSNCYPKKGNYNAFSIQNVLHKLKWETLEERRNQARLIMAYKIIKENVILDSNMLPLTQTKQPNRKCKGKVPTSQYQLEEPFCKVDMSKKTFFHAVPRLWNSSITDSQANAPSVEAFKQHFKKSYY